MTRITRSGHSSFVIRVIALFVAMAWAALAPQPSRASAAPGAGACNASTMRGVYAIHMTGTMLAQPLAVVGHVAFKRAGRAAGVVTEVWNGQPNRYTFDGTYSLDADCRGELSFKAERPLPHERIFEFYPRAGGKRASLVLKGAHLEGMAADEDQELFANSSIILSGTSERLSRRRMTCDQEDARGRYAYDATGVTMGGPLFTFTFAGRAELDGEGGVSIHSVGTMPHAVDAHAHYTGTYSMDPRCRGEMRVSGEHFEIEDNHIGHFYAAARGKVVYMIFTRSWVDRYLGVDLNPLGINEDLAQGEEQEFSYTFTGIGERQ